MTTNKQTNKQIKIFALIFIVLAPIIAIWSCSKADLSQDEDYKKEIKSVENFAGTALKATLSKVNLAKIAPKTKAPSDWLKDPSELVAYEFEAVDENGTEQMKTYFVYNVDSFNTGSVIQYTENMIELGRHVYTNGILTDIIIPENDLLLQSQNGFKSWWNCTKDVYFQKKEEFSRKDGYEMLCDAAGDSCPIYLIAVSAIVCAGKEAGIQPNN